jgi:hypothetical protein
VAVENRVHGADRWRVDIRIESGQLLPDFRGPPTRLVLLQAYDPCLDLDGELVGVTVEPARAVRQPFQATKHHYTRALMDFGHDQLAIGRKLRVLLESRRYQMGYLCATLIVEFPGAPERDVSRRRERQRQFCFSLIAENQIR